MTPDQLARARKRLGLSLEQMAEMLGYEGANARSQMHHLETGRRDLRPAQRRLVEAYLGGWRPDDWPPTITDTGE
jgi:transcriptional regulator with XRE-family HTH domain